MWMPGRSTEHILVVEDDPIVSEILRATLEYSGYTCEAVTTAASALDRFRTSRPDAILTDLALPDSDGMDLVSALRDLSQIPVLVLSGRRSEADKIAALDRGADDYIEKPFLPGELVARIRAKLRQARHHQPVETENPYKIDAATEASLSRMERTLLSALVRHQGATVSEQKLIAGIWGPYRQATNGDLRSLVLKLRRKLQEQHHSLFVFNERGVGYRISGFGRFPRYLGDARSPADEPSSAPPQVLEGGLEDSVRASAAPGY
jgi:two-component system KDP operon response regulator KdpE